VSRLPLGSGQRCLVDAMSGNTDLRLSNVTVTFPGWVGSRSGLSFRDKPALGARQSEGSSPSRRDHRATHLYLVDPVWIRTMMQSYASAAKLRGGGPILNRGAQAMSNIGLPPPRIVICSQ